MTVNQCTTYSFTLLTTYAQHDSTSMAASNVTHYSQQQLILETSTYTPELCIPHPYTLKSDSRKSDVILSPCSKLYLQFRISTSGDSDSRKRSAGMKQSRHNTHSVLQRHSTAYSDKCIPRNIQL